MVVFCFHLQMKLSKVNGMGEIDHNVCILLIHVYFFHIFPGISNQASVLTEFHTPV